MKKVGEEREQRVQVRWQVKGVAVGLGSLVMSVGLSLPSMGNPHLSAPEAIQAESTNEITLFEDEAPGVQTGDRPLEPTPVETSSTIPQSPSPQRTQPILRLRHGPYFPNLDVLAPPSPEPIFPAIVQPIKLVIRLSERRVYVYQGDEVQTSYPIAVGKDGWETPTGNYEVLDMQENPAWKNPFNGTIIPAGRNNPLGDRWIGFWTDGNNVIGFHGTPNEGSVGRAASHGCIRMFNHDVRALYAIAEIGMPVTVEP